MKKCMAREACVLHEEQVNRHKNRDSISKMLSKKNTVPPDTVCRADRVQRIRAVVQVDTSNSIVQSASNNKHSVFATQRHPSTVYSVHGIPAHKVVLAQEVLVLVPVDIDC